MRTWTCPQCDRPAIRGFYCSMACRYEALQDIEDAIKTVRKNKREIKRIKKS